VRLGHGFVVFPGGAGTAEEVLYLLGILLHPENVDRIFPLIFTGPESSREYFTELVDFIETTLGPATRAKIEVIIADPVMVALRMHEQVNTVLERRQRKDEAIYFNWPLVTQLDLQIPFDATHENMARLALSRDQPAHTLARNLRCAFAGIVSGNVKEEGMRRVEANGPFEIRGEKAIMQALDRLLRGFVAQQRMRLPGRAYVPSYRVVT
jgi:hypothetical protein